MGHDMAQYDALLAGQACGQGDSKHKPELSQDIPKRALLLLSWALKPAREWWQSDQEFGGVRH